MATKIPPRRPYNFLRRKPAKDAKKAPRKGFEFGRSGVRGTEKKPVGR